MNYVKLGQERFSELVNKMGVDCVDTKRTKTELRIAELEAERDRLRGALDVIPVDGMAVIGPPYTVHFSEDAFEAIRTALSATGEPAPPEPDDAEEVERG